MYETLFPRQLLISSGNGCFDESMGLGTNKDVLLCFYYYFFLLFLLLWVTNLNFQNNLYPILLAMVDLKLYGKLNISKGNIDRY